MPNSNKNYRLHPSTQSLHDSYLNFISHYSLNQLSDQLSSNHSNHNSIPPFEELSSNERLLFYYWNDVQEKLNDTAVNSGIKLYSALVETYRKVIYKTYYLEYNENKEENNIDDVG